MLMSKKLGGQAYSIITFCLSNCQKIEKDL